MAVLIVEMHSILSEIVEAGHADVVREVLTGGVTEPVVPVIVCIHCLNGAPFFMPFSLFLEHMIAMF